MIRVGTAGPGGLVQHQGKKKCRASVEKRKMAEKQSGQVRTLFEFGVKKGTTSTALELTPPRRSGISAPPLVIPSPRTAQAHQDEHHDEELVIATKSGCPLGWRLINQVRAMAQELPMDVPPGVAGDEIAAFGRDMAIAVSEGVEDDEIWEHADPILNRLLGYGRSKPEIQQLVRRGEKGVEGLCEFLGYLVATVPVASLLFYGEIPAVHVIMYHHVCHSLGEL
ncbi:hypothetical protein BD779DRAFT_1477859 [Infundibulicybe gibba]|nr:hypothetical protein BD779DRAFT_1477859 [Infundibulicybe gibba]